MNKKLVRVIVFILIAGMLQLGYMVYSMNTDVTSDSGDETVNVNPPTTRTEADKMPDTEIKVKKQPKKEIDISGVTISSEIEAFITGADSKNAEKNINNYKKLLKELDVTELLRGELENVMKKGHKLSDVFMAYEYLYENYGTIDELDTLLEGKKSKKDWAEAFRAYTQNNPEFEPTSFAPGYLESLLNVPSLNPDDVMIADRISKKGIKTFEELITMRKEGKTWKEIKTELRLINTSDKFPRIAMTGGEVQKYMKETGLSEKEVMDALVLAKRFDKDEKTMVDKIKKGNKKEDIYAHVYDEKYK